MLSAYCPGPFPALLRKYSSQRSSTFLFDSNDCPVWQTLIDTRPVLDVSSQLPAGCCDIIATGFTHSGHNTCIHQNARKLAYAHMRRAFQARLREGIERNQIQFTPHPACDFDQLARMLVSVVDTIEHNVLEGNEISWGCFQIAVARIQQLYQRVLAV